MTKGDKQKKVEECSHGDTIWGDICLDCGHRQVNPPTEEKLCNCRGNLNANHPELPCSSCGGINPMLTKPDTKIEWEKEIDTCISAIVGSQSEVEIVDAADHIKSIVKDQQDSFRRKVEEEVIGEREYATKPMDPTDFAELIGRNKLRAIQRAKLKTLSGLQPKRV